jgi:hypothetical protein
MNIKFSTGAVRCRVTKEELDALLLGRSIKLEVPLPRHHAFRMNVRPVVVGGWLLESDPTGYWIAIPRASLETLAQSQPSKAGIENDFDLGGGGTVHVSFEVDVRKTK